MESEGSLPHAQVPATCSYPEHNIMNTDPKRRNHFSSLCNFIFKMFGYRNYQIAWSGFTGGLVGRTSEGFMVIQTLA